MELVVTIAAWLMSGCLGIYTFNERCQGKLSWVVIKKNPLTMAELVLTGPCMLIISFTSPETQEWQSYSNEIIKEEVDSYIDNDWLEKEFQALEAQVVNR